MCIPKPGRACKHSQRPNYFAMSAEKARGRWICSNNYQSGTVNGSIRSGAQIMADESTPIDLIFDEDTGTREAAALTRALVDAEDRYRALVEQSLLGLWVTQGLPPRFVLVNRGVARMVGYSVEELLAMEPEDVVQLIHPEDLDVALSPYLKLLDSGATQDEVTFRFLRSDGDVRWLQAIASAVEFQGKPAVQALVIDVTDSVEALEALRKSEARYRLLAENLNDIIWTMDLDFNVMFVSRSEARLRGLPIEEVRSQTLEQRWLRRWKRSAPGTRPSR